MPITTGLEKLQAGKQDYYTYRYYRPLSCSFQL